MTATRTPRPAVAPTAGPKHSPFEDLFGLLVGTVLASFGLLLLHSSTTVTGGTAGLSLLLSYAFNVPFEWLFVMVNLPFLVLALPRKGVAFTVRTLVAIGAVTALTRLHALVLPALELPAVYATVLGNMLAGVGLLIVFRHGASLGGFNVVGLIVQERRGIQAGYVLMVLDLAVVLAALAVLPWQSVAWSALGAIVLNLIIALNHRSDRYLGW